MKHEGEKRKMNTYFYLIALEIMTIIFFTAHVCSQKRLKTAVVLFLFVLGLIGVTGYVLIVQSIIPGWGKGQGYFLILGLFLFSPFLLVYGRPYKHTLMILFSTWIYVFAMFTVSFRISYLFPESQRAMVACISYTLMIALTYHTFIRFFKRKFLFILAHVDRQTYDIALVLIFAWFMLLGILNASFYTRLGPVIEIAFILLLSLSIVLSYHVFYALASSKKEVATLDEKSKLDPLTGLRNRVTLSNDMRGFIQLQKSFTLIFMDLDDFKGINDCYGHNFGDDYLLKFVHHISQLIRDEDRFYRVSGDEFVILTLGNDGAGMCRRISDFDIDDVEFNRIFTGVSLGIARYPEDGNEAKNLLYTADMRMYDAKKKKDHILQGVARD